MPIRNPPDWAETSLRIRFVRAKGLCETCRRPHGKMVYCLADGRWYDVDVEGWVSGRGVAVEAPEIADLMGMRLTRVVTAAAHLDHDPGHTDDANLAALCQRCHILHDASHHQWQRRLGYRLRWAIGDLFAGLYSRAGYPRNGAGGAA